MDRDKVRWEQQQQKNENEMTTYGMHWNYVNEFAVNFAIIQRILFVYIYIYISLHNWTHSLRHEYMKYS